MAPSRLLRARLVLAAVEVLLASAAAPGIQEFDFYRAMPSSGVGVWTLQNFNLASIAGVAKYLHTEVIAEHVVGNPERKERKYGIDAIARMRFKVKNPDRLLSELPVGVDFGPFVTFDSGIATNPASQLWTQQFGAYVGVQQQFDFRFPYTEPYFWFSATGWCPNLHYSRIPMTRQAASALERDWQYLCQAQKSRSACEAHRSECAYDGALCWARDPAPKCLNLSLSLGSTGHVLGGLCPGGEENLDVEPTGELGCTYSYGKASQVSIDRLAGILDEDCGGRHCRDWLDFRMHCSNSAYRRTFDSVTHRTVPFEYCVEYDIHPDCAADCRRESCQQLPAAERELGLPFWRGRCDAPMNEARAERFGEILGVATAATSHDMVGGTIDVEHTCIREAPGRCTPQPEQGGSYCTRQWAGVCSNCFVPGTSVPWSEDHMPYCPYNILHIRDYDGRYPEPRCKSSHPRDLCCLYTGGCSLDASDLRRLPLDEDGYSLVASLQSTSKMAAFLRHAAEAASLSVNSSALEPFAYSRWARQPRRGASLGQALDEMLGRGVAVGVRTSPKRENPDPDYFYDDDYRYIRDTTATTTPLEVMGEKPGAPFKIFCGVLAGVCLAASALCILGRFRGFCAKDTLPAQAQPASQPASIPNDVDVEALIALPRICLFGRSGASTGQSSSLQKEPPCHGGVELGESQPQLDGALPSGEGPFKAKDAIAQVAMPIRIGQASLARPTPKVEAQEEAAPASIVAPFVSEGQEWTLEEARELGELWGPQIEQLDLKDIRHKVPQSSAAPSTPRKAPDPRSFPSLSSFEPIAWTETSTSSQGSSSSTTAQATHAPSARSVVPRLAGLQQLCAAARGAPSHEAAEVQSTDSDRMPSLVSPDSQQRANDAGSIAYVQV